MTDEPNNPSSDVSLRADDVNLAGNLVIPRKSRAIVVFAHGSGSTRLSSRNRLLAKSLNDDGFATLLLDLLTPKEDELDQLTHKFRFNIELLAKRLIEAIDWLSQYPPTQLLRLGLFGASASAAAALIAASERTERVAAVVSRGGRLDLAGDALTRVRASTLLIVGGHDHTVVGLNQAACRLLYVRRELHIIPGATHLFEEPGKLELVAELALDWFRQHLLEYSKAC